ncbi:MAG: hypothetical protein ACM31C_34310 [Acidobacteriota bacterium]
MARSYLALLLLGACVEQAPSGPGTRGSIEDVTTASGTYAGYRFVMPCPTHYAALGVTGTGTIALSKVDALGATGDDLVAQLGIASIWGHGVGFGCEPGVAVTIELSSWLDVDALIAGAGAYLHDRDLAVAVAVDVVPVPVPDAR